MLGKIIGGAIGFFTLGGFGAFVGVLVGHFFDTGLTKLRQDESPEALQAIQETFFHTTFILIGYLAKADGRVSEEEINTTQALMDKLELTADHKREAIRLFKIGSAPDFAPQATLQTFRDVCGKRVQLTQMLIVYLVNTALADGKFDPKEETALRQVAQGLHFSHMALEQLLRMIRAQGSFAGGEYHHHQANSGSKPGELANAYAALGVTESDTDKDVKKAYRKLMSQYHPDKLMGQGVPEDMLKVATERAQEVQTAYDVIKTSRKT